jgi:hypothetical protein
LIGQVELVMAPEDQVFMARATEAADDCAAHQASVTRDEDLGVAIHD